MPSFDQKVTHSLTTELPPGHHPNTNHFNRSFQALQSRVESEVLIDFIKTLPGEETQEFRKNVSFEVNNDVYSYPVVLLLGFVSGGGRLWACPDGNVICQRATPRDPAKLWTSSDESVIRGWIGCDDDAPLRIGPPGPFNQHPALVNGLVSPMGPRAQALVQFYIILHALGTDMTRHRLAFPDLKYLVAAFKLLTPPAVEKQQNPAASTKPTQGIPAIDPVGTIESSPPIENQKDGANALSTFLVPRVSKSSASPEIS
ncbi:hypothetical protein CC86DRAFT_388386 [Ophiobolus disseminans]|uniref:Uncharacterized protein n=1 Tax=Ophiobolus disseminans TaxID=1469910 RepID=A0A6A6ZEX0_9PLEO|nr:hypothetical protein CC86DRAFT_388386 [Ophiobolus disseminans]